MERKGESKLSVHETSKIKQRHNEQPHFLAQGEYSTIDEPSPEMRVKGFSKVPCPVLVIIPVLRRKVILKNGHGCLVGLGIKLWREETRKNERKNEETGTMKREGGCLHRE
jgi:hypothetical protein